MTQPLGRDGQNADGVPLVVAVGEEKDNALIKEDPLVVTGLPGVDDPSPGELDGPKTNELDSGDDPPEEVVKTAEEGTRVLEDRELVVAITESEMSDEAGTLVPDKVDSDVMVWIMVVSIVAALSELDEDEGALD